MKLPLLGPKISNILRKFAPFLVFTMALVIRLFYDLVINQHRLASFGDGYFYLKTGQELAKAMTQATGFSDFLAKLTVHTSSVAGAVATFGSGALADRLLLDGPVFTTYLAIVQILAGIVSSGDFAHNSNTYSIANSVVDSLSCVLVYLCGRWAFSARAGLVGALLLALYPASVLNTRLCYSELFTYFLLLVWSFLTLDLLKVEEGRAIRRSLAVCLLWGASSFIIVLAKSVLLPLPVVGFLILCAGWIRGPQMKLIVVPRIAAMVVGTAIVMTPWLWFTHEITGKSTPWVNRAPGYNLFVGNQLYTDGWRTWPAQPGIPNETSAALQSVSHNFSTNPGQFISLQLRKVARLWAGVWNDFQHKYYGFSWQYQNIFHDIIIALAFIGFLAGCRKSEEPSVSRRASLLFAFVALYHSVYACFEPVARYAISAMPFVCLLSGHALSLIEKPWLNRMFLRVVVFAVLLFALLNSHFSFVPLFLLALPQSYVLASVLDGFIWVAFWSLLALSSCQLLDGITGRSTGSKGVSPAHESPDRNFSEKRGADLDGSFTGSAGVSPAFESADRSSPSNRYATAQPRQERIVLWGAAVVFSIITICSLVFDPARTEWYTEISTKDDVLKLSRALPARPPGPTAATSFVLVDLQSKRPTPEVFLAVNGRRSAPPIPVMELMHDRKDAAEIFALQAQAMTVDPRSFRHWWAFPLATEDLKFDAENEILLKADLENGVDNADPFAIFGDYPIAEQSNSINLPSINKFSWVKGFVTIDRRDPRPYEVMIVRGRQGSSSFNESTDDLSRCIGRQFGRVRLMFYVPPVAANNASGVREPVKQEVLFQRKEESVIVGGDPSTMTLTGAGVHFPASEDGCSFYELNCELQPSKNRTIGSITVSFQAPGKADKFSSPWCPMALTLTSNGWQRFTFVDRLPDDLASRQDLTAAVSIAPFPADRLFLHRRSALRDSVKVRNVELKRFVLSVPKGSNVDGERLY